MGLFDFGNSSVINLILNEVVKLNHISHAWLFYCESLFEGKDIAKKFVMAICCKSQVEKPCFNCDVCNKILNGNCVDYFEFDVIDNNKNNFTVEQSRNLIVEAFVKPVELKKKIFIINGVDNLLVGAANALLKLLEEPPHNVIFILIGQNPMNVLKTISSRCFKLHLQSFDEQTCLDILKKNVNLNYSDDCLKEAVIYSEGWLTIAKLILTDSSYKTALNIAKQMLSNFLSGNELNFLKNVAIIEADLNLTLLTLHFFCVCLRQTLHNKVLFNGGFTNIFFQRIMKVNSCLEQAYKHILKNGNLKLVLNKLCCSLF